MKEIIAASENIISRSGYTTIMELVSMGRTAMIIPTPGQTEQEYLAEYLSEKGWFDTIAQKEINQIFYTIMGIRHGLKRLMPRAAFCWIEPSRSF